MATIGLQGRGVMVDFQRKYGNAKIAVDHAMFEEILREQGVVVEPGDILALRTGWAQLLVDMQGSPDKRSCTTRAPGSDSRDPKLLEWIARERHRRDRRRQPRCRSVSAQSGRPGDAVPAAARALPVQARHQPGRDVAPHGARRLAAGQRANPVLSDRATAALARSRRITGHADRHRLRKHDNKPQLLLRRCVRGEVRQRLDVTLPAQRFDVVEQGDIGAERGKRAKEQRELAVALQGLRQLHGTCNVDVPVARVGRNRFEVAVPREHGRGRFRTPACKPGKPSAASPTSAK